MMLSELIKKQTFLSNSQRFISRLYEQLYTYARNHDFELNSDEDDYNTLFTLLCIQNDDKYHLAFKDDIIVKHTRKIKYIKLGISFAVYENLSEVQNRKAPNLFLKIYKLLYLRNKRLANRRKITFIQSQINFTRTGFQYAYTSKTYS